MVFVHEDFYCCKTEINDTGKENKQKQNGLNARFLTILLYTPRQCSVFLICIVNGAGVFVAVQCRKVEVKCVIRNDVVHQNTCRCRHPVFLASIVERPAFLPVHAVLSLQQCLRVRWEQYRRRFLQLGEAHCKKLSIFVVDNDVALQIQPPCFVVVVATLAQSFLQDAEYHVGKDT